jgi:hypothetical protein
MINNGNSKKPLYQPMNRAAYAEYVEDIRACFFETLEGYGATDNYSKIRLVMNSFRRNLKTENLISSIYISSLINGIYGNMDDIYISALGGSDIKSDTLLNFISSFIIRLDSKTAGYNQPNNCFECNIVYSFLGDKIGVHLDDADIAEHNVYPKIVSENRASKINSSEELITTLLVNRIYYAIIILQMYAPIHMDS